MTVTDNGIGIRPEELPHVFERFWRGSQAGPAAGSGIGPTVVSELVRAHQGARSR
ncbi:MAG: ATP-binding protein [Acidimicrobiia bacterium]